MEHVTGGELFDYILNAKTSISECTARTIFKQLVSAVQHCHSNNFAHRDIKPENILLTSDNNVKLIDFGLSALYEGKHTDLTTVLGTSSYVAPEILNGSYDLKVDVWACGVILYLLLSRCLPYGGDSINQVVRNIHYLRTPPFQKSIWKEISGSAKDLIKKMLTIDPLKRLDINEVLEHPWMKDSEETLGVYELIREITKTLKTENLLSDELSILFQGIFDRSEGKDMENTVTHITDFIKKTDNLYAQNIKEAFLEANSLTLDKIEIHVQS